MRLFCVLKRWRKRKEENSAEVNNNRWDILDLFVFVQIYHTYLEMSLHIAELNDRMEDIFVVCFQT